MMPTDRTSGNAMAASNIPDVPGLTLRGFRGEVDYAAMLAIVNGSKEADGVECTNTLEEITRGYQYLVNCDPYRDMLFAEVQDEVVGYSRVWWAEDLQGTRVYKHLCFMLPEWRDKGIRQAMLRLEESRLREIAAGHPPTGSRWFEAWATDTESHWEALLTSHGYKGMRYGYSMVRPDLEDIPDMPLPTGVETRPALPEHYRPIWEAARDAFRDEWMYSEVEWTDEQFEGWQKEATFEPSLWQIAWDGDEIVGMILNFVDELENEEYNRKRGYTETICVRRAWRRRGIARALITRSFRTIKERGMSEAALGVDTQNSNGALQLYEGMGFRPVKRRTTYRKLMS